MKITISMFALGFFTMPTIAQLSPGDLHQSHQHLEGLGQCTQCHEIGVTQFKDKCLDCHLLLRERMETGKGLHGQSGFDQCQSCHVDHQGRQFNLINWPGGQEAFDHKRTGYLLIGAHESLACNDCHKPDYIKDREGLKQAGKDLAKTFFGLSTACNDCHLDNHRGQFEQSCDSCHNQNQWAPATGFDHNLARFVLQGKHLEAACSDCHPKVIDPNHPQGELFSRFKPLTFAECLDCHQDGHEGQMNRDCLSCHDMNLWKPAIKFDHGKTAFSLTGLHKEITCGSCHPNQERGIFKQETFRDPKNCADCHRDIHHQRMGNQCSSCHSTQGWAQIRTGTFDHQKTRFPLRGKHRQVECKACHVNGVAEGLPSFNRCSDCHPDIHQGQIAVSEYERGCASCHGVEGFTPAHFSTSRHQQTMFPLEGAHQAVPCNLCHVSQTQPESKRQIQIFHFLNTNCQSCHQNPHLDSVERFMRPGQVGCETCHVVSSWSDSQYDHQTTAFPLTGNHQNVSCRECHINQPEDQEEAQVFSWHHNACSDCHLDPHQGQFAESGAFAQQTDCQRCHVTQDWFAEKFDHSRHATFPLEGAHGEAECSACHPVETAAGKSMMRFKPVDSRCESCHLEKRER